MPPFSLYTIVSAARATTARRAPSGDRRARHSATSSTLRRFKAPRVRQTSFPSGTAAVRSLPLAAAAAREAHLHVAPTAQPRVSWPHTLPTAVDQAAAWSSHSRSLQLTLETSTKEETFCKIKCIKLLLISEHSTNVECHLTMLFLTFFRACLCAHFFPSNISRTFAQTLRYRQL